MKNFIILALSFLVVINSHSQTFTRLKAETVEKFVKRIYLVKEKDLDCKFFEKFQSNSKKKAIFCFVGDYFLMQGFLLIEINDSSYKQVILGGFSGNAGTSTVEITNQFFVNTDEDEQKEIIVSFRLRSKSPRFSANDVVGFYYENRVYDNPNIEIPQDSLKVISSLTEILSDDFEGSIYSKKTGKLIEKRNALYKKEENIRAKLKQLGYK